MAYSQRTGLYAGQSALPDDHPEIVISVLVSVTLIAFSSVNLQFQNWFVPISLKRVFKIVEDLSWHRLVIMQLTSTTVWGFQYLQDSSQDMAQNIIYSP